MSTDKAATARRPYRKLLPAQEVELVQLWEAGGHTAEDLAILFGLSRRGIQAAVSRLGAKRRRRPAGAAPGAVAEIRARVCAAPLPVAADQADRTVALLDAAFANASHLEALTMATVDDAAAAGGIAALRALDIAASALARITTIKRQAAGLGASNPITIGDLPELTVRELTAEEIAAIRDQQVAEDNAAMSSTDDDDNVVAEGDDDASDRRAA